MVKCEEIKQSIRQYKMEEQLLIPEDEIMEKIEAKMKAAEWEEINEESPSEYLAEEEPNTLEEEFNLNQMTYKSEEDENITQEEIDEILNEYQDIVSKGDHDIRNCNLIEHAIRLTDNIPTTYRLRQRSPKENKWIKN